jgi:hypothetical protein
MKTVMTALAGAVLFAASAAATEVWTDVPAPSGPTATVAMAGGNGDAEPTFGQATGRYDNLASARAVTIVAEGDAYNVIPHAFEGGRAPAPRAVAGLARPGGG